MTPSRNTRSYTLWSVPSSPGRSTLTLKNINLDSLDSCSYLAHPSWIAIYLNVHNSIVQLRDHNSCFSVLFVLSSSCQDFKLPYYSGFRPYHTSTILHTILLVFHTWINLLNTALHSSQPNCFFPVLCIKLKKLKKLIHKFFFTNAAKF